MPLLSFYLSLGALLVMMWPAQRALGVSEDEFAEKFETLIWPMYQEKAKSSFFTGYANKKIHYVTIQQNPEKTAETLIVILPGRTESVFKYAELVYDLYPSGADFAIIDHRGQGKSDRLSETVGASYVENFAAYTADFRQLVLQELPGDYKNKYAIAHSMGANILSLFVTEYPEVFDRIVLASPMLDIPTEPLPESITYYLFKMMTFFGQGAEFLPGHKQYEPGEPYRGTHSEVRFAGVAAKRNFYKEEWIGGVSYHWIVEALKATQKMREDAEKIRMPVLMLQAGADEIVKTEGQTYVCEQAPQCTLKIFPESLHEILNEKDEIRQPALKAIIEFLNLESK